MTRTKWNHRGAMAAALVIVLSLPGDGRTQGPLPSERGDDPTSRIDALETLVGQLRTEVDRLRSAPVGIVRLPAVADAGVVAAEHTWLEPAAYSSAYRRDCAQGTHYLTYDDGWVMRPRRPAQTPFELQINLHNQFRHTGFATAVDSFTDSAGVTRPIGDRNDFDINRGRLVFSGYAFDPDFGFYANIDYNTVAEEQMQLLMSWISLGFHESLTVAFGLGKVPGTWEWLETSRLTLGAERTMATTFFRPSMTAGIWAHGELYDGLFYRALVGDGFNTFSLRAAELDTNLAYSGMLWWEPLDAFGPGFSDLEYHERLALRLGQAFTATRNDGQQQGEPGPEQTVVRLSDGTRLVEPGALAPGVTVNSFDISLYALHLGLKYRGASLAGEYLLRWLSSISGTGPLPVSSLFDHGFLVQGGLFVVPQRLELYGLGSLVTGDFGTGYEVGGGLNWYLQGRRGARLTFDVVYFEDSPAQQDRTGYVAGGTGALLRTQLWTFF